jgi:hypothetical protein
MDPAGAALLYRRIEQQRHWEQADAVRDGRQLPVDPDGDELEELGDGIRIYAVRRDGETIRRCKRLIDGRWQHAALSAEDHQTILKTSVQRVA